MFQPIDLGPHSLLWRWAGDRRLGFTGGSGGILQLMHPGLGAGVAEHSNFFDDPMDRVVRSMPAILGTVYDADAEATGHMVRGFHNHISGTDQQGRKYHALTPETFWWAHATFQHMVEQLVDRFSHHNLRPAEREQLYREGVEWYRRYGVSMRPVPADRAAFERVWDHFCADVLEMTPAAERAVDIALHYRGLDVPLLPAWTKPMQRFTIGPVVRLVTIGGLPEVVRKRFGIPWRIDDDVELRAFEAAVRASWRAVPTAVRYHPRAAAALARTRVAVPA